MIDNLGRGAGGHTHQYSACQQINRISLMLVKFLLLIKLEESYLSKKWLERSLFVGNWGCVSH